MYFLKKLDVSIFKIKLRNSFTIEYIAQSRIKKIKKQLYYY